MVKFDRLNRLIKDNFSYSSEQRGTAYYHKGRVEELYYDRSENTWFAEVEGSLIYDVKIIFNETDIVYGCNCPQFDQHVECKHIVACLYEIRDLLSSNPDPHKYPFLKESLIFNDIPFTPYPVNASNQLIQTFAEQEKALQQTVGLESLQVEFHCKLVSSWWYAPSHFQIEIKVGVQRTYVVQKINEFLEHFDQEKSLFFTKKFTYDPRKHYFQEKDLEIIQLLSSIYKMQAFYQEEWQRPASIRSLKVPPRFASELLPLLEKRDCSFQTKQGTYPDMNWMDNQFPLEFQLKKTGQNYEMDFSILNNYIYLADHQYLIKENDIYKLSAEQNKILTQILRDPQLARKQALVIGHSDIHGFLSYVRPKLKKLGTVDLDEEVQEVVISPPLHAKLFLDQSDKTLTGKLEFHYGDIKISPLQNNNENLKTDRILIREVDKESQILSWLEHTPFKNDGEVLFIEDDDEMFHFIYELLPEIYSLCEVYTTETIKRNFLENRHSPALQVDLETSGHYLDISFDFQDIEDQEISHILQSIAEKKKYVRLSSGVFLPLKEEGYEAIAGLMEELNLAPGEFAKGQVNLPAFRSLQVHDALHEKVAHHTNKAFRQLVHQIQSPEDQDYPLPQGIHATLRDYQNTGFQWFKALSHYGFGGILADDMGLGKTLQSITFIQSQYEENSGESMPPALIISPASLIYNWKQEFEKFAPNLRVRIINGTKGERQESLQKWNDADVVITSYPLLRQDEDLYVELNFSTMILDEAQAIKNHATKTAKAVKKINARHRFALSGTPIENSLDELWSLFDGVMPHFFKNKKLFNQLPPEKIARLTRPFILRRLKRDVLKELPDKIETVYESELTRQQKELYLGYLKKIQGEAVSAIENEGFQKSRIKILAGLTRLRQLCCHPSLFIENYKGESGKLNQLLEMVETALENGQRLLIFSQFSSMLKLIKEALAARGETPFYLDGETKPEERVNMAFRFNQGEKRIFLISLKAGGTGLNLTGADTVILYDLWWNPAVEEQATGRAHRIGQKRVVQVFRFIAQGTIEEKIYELQQKKKGLIDNVIQPGETMLSSLTEEDIRELLSV